MIDQLLPYTQNFLTIASIHLIACMSPGPDMILTIRNTLQYSPKIALIGVMGTVLGIALHLTYTLLGIGLLVHQFPWVQIVFKIVGAVWLFYIGYKSLITTATIQDQIKLNSHFKNISLIKAFRTSFITNALNPFVILLFIGILSNEIEPTTPLWIQVMMGVMMMIIAFCWFTFLALSFSFKPVKAAFLKLGPWLDRVTGAVLIIFSVKLALSAFN